MVKEQTVNAGEYKIIIKHNDSGNGHLVVTIHDELGELIDGIEVYNSDEDESK